VKGRDGRCLFGRYIKDEDEVEEVGYAVVIAQAINIFKWVEGTREWRVEGILERKVARVEQEAEEKQRWGTRLADDAMQVNDDDILYDDSDESEDDKTTQPRSRYDKYGVCSVTVNNQLTNHHLFL